MAGGLGADLSGVKGYTVGLLFLAFVVISKFSKKNGDEKNNKNDVKRSVLFSAL